MDSMKKVAFHATACESQHRRDIFAGQTFQTPQDKDLALARREPTKELPDTLLLFAAQEVLFRGRVVAGKFGFLKFDVLVSPPPPPRRSASVATGVDRDPREPRRPRQNLTLALALFHQLEEHFLCDLLGFMTVNQKQPAQLENPCVMRAAEFFAARGYVWQELGRFRGFHDSLV